MAAKAISDISRGEVSDFGDYAADAFRESVIGAVSGAVFGPLGAGAPILGKMVVGGVSGAAESIVSQLTDGDPGFSWGQVLFTAGVGFGTAGLLDAKIAQKTIGEYISQGATKIAPKWIADGFGKIGEGFGKFVGNLNDWGTSLGKGYMKETQQFAQSIASSVTGTLNKSVNRLTKDIADLGQMGKELGQKFKNSVQMPRFGYELAFDGPPLLANQIGNQFGKSTTNSANVLQSSSKAVTRAVGGGGTGGTGKTSGEGLPLDRKKYYRQKIDEANARGDLKAADDARYERYCEEKLDKGEKPVSRKKWDELTEQLRKNRANGIEQEIAGRNALEKQLGRELKDNNTGEVLTFESSEGHLTRPDSIARNEKGEIDLIHDHKHKSSSEDQVVYNDSQMRAEREMLEAGNGKHIVTISSDSPNLDAIPPRPRPSAPLGKESTVYYVDPESGKITRIWKVDESIQGGGYWVDP